jgi:hypothetical protein
MSHLKPHVYGNFKKPKGAKKPKASKRAKRPGMSKDHVALIRRMPCCVTLAMPGGEIHHLKSGEAKQERGTGMRATDRWGVPMSHDAHMALERVGSRGERKWFRDRGIENPHALAAALWGATGDLPRMIKVLMAHVRGAA